MCRDIQRASRDVRRSVLRCAELCVCTLSAAGGDLANLMVTKQQRSRGTCSDTELRFDAVIIDEAAQAQEPATLIPLHALNPIKVQPRLSYLRLCVSLHTGGANCTVIPGAICSDGHSR